MLPLFFYIYFWIAIPKEAKVNIGAFNNLINQIMDLIAQAIIYIIIKVFQSYLQINVLLLIPVPFLHF